MGVPATSESGLTFSGLCGIAISGSSESKSIASVASMCASGSLRSVVHGLSVRPSRYSAVFSSAGKMPVSDPASTAMFATASRSSIVSASAPGPTNSSAMFVPPPAPISASTARITSFPDT
jgi:hypothetical protein